jgi:hypothetical protein
MCPLPMEADAAGAQEPGWLMAKMMSDIGCYVGGCDKTFSVEKVSFEDIKAC